MVCALRWPAHEPHDGGMRVAPHTPQGYRAPPSLCVWQRDRAPASCTPALQAAARLATPWEAVAQAVLAAAPLSVRWQPRPRCAPLALG